MKLNFLVLLFGCSVLLTSCKKENQVNENGEDFLEITANGKTYKNTLVNGFGFSNISGCNSKPHALSSISQIDVAALFFGVLLKHYENNVDFQISNKGTYGVKEDNTFVGPSNSCNLDIEVSLDDKTKPNQSTILQASSNSHTVTDIKKISETSTNVSYKVIGIFSSSFKNSANDLIVITGKYQTTIQVLK